MSRGLQPLKIAINVQLVANQGVGGIQTAITGLVSALGKLDGPEEYVIIGAWQDPDWLQPYLGPNQKIIRGPKPEWAVEKRPGFKDRIRYVLGPVWPVLRNIKRKLIGASTLPQSPYWPVVPISDGFFENLNCAVIHFPWQEFILCAVPSIYNPHDLQHLHYPQFFSPQRIAELETVFPFACRVANTVVVHSQWAKMDLINQYGLATNKIQVIPLAPPTQFYKDPSDTFLHSIKQKYHLPDQFAFYPAMTWEHKNHVRLLEALAFLRDQKDLVVPLVCTGKQRLPHWNRIEAKIIENHLEEQALFLGMVPVDDLRAIYRLSQFVIVPTLFEGAGIPVIEAFNEGAAVACSRVTSLPEEVGDAALFFNPFSIDEIAGAIQKMVVDNDYRLKLKKLGQERLRAFSWERTAKANRAVYRKVAHHPLTDEDNFILSWDWLQNPPSDKEFQVL